MTISDIVAEQQHLVDAAWAEATRVDGTVDMDKYNAMATAINDLVAHWLAELKKQEVQ